MLYPGTLYFILVIRVIFFFFNPSIIYAQAPEIEWQKSIGGSGWDVIYGLEKTDDHGFILIGESYSTDGDVIENLGYSDFWVVKMDSSGFLQWRKTFGGTSIDNGRSILQTEDGGYMIVGYTYSNDGDITINHGDSDCWVIKLDSLGNLIWQKTYGGSASEEALSVIETNDGGYIFCGFSSSDNGDVSFHHGDVGLTSDFWIVKIDLAGEIVWEKSLGGSEDDKARSLIKTNDNGILVTGSSNSSNGDLTANFGGSDYWVVKLNSEGIIQWQKNYGGSDADNLFSVTSTLVDGFLVCAGETLSNNGDVSFKHEGVWPDLWIIKIDSLGELVWERSLGGTGTDRAYNINFTNDSMYIISGITTSNDFDVDITYGGGDFWILKITDEGIIVWQKTFGGSLYDECRSINQTENGGFICGGSSKSTDGDVTGNHGNYDYWVVKLSPPCTPIVYYADMDHDNFGDLYIDSLSCNMPDGYVSDSSDCNDANAAINPATEDICNGMDDNCNFIIDEDAIYTYLFADTDLDGFGNATEDSLSCLPVTGYVSDSSDCNDSDYFINPATFELCNTMDDNCNGMIDESLLLYVFYADSDGDGFGNSDSMEVNCLEFIPGYVSDSTDCDDANDAVHPDALELCNTMDDNCNGSTDEGLALYILYADQDSDTFGNNTYDTISCFNTIAGFVSDNTDCNDYDPEIYPGAPETLNGLDDDCDQMTDEYLSSADFFSTTMVIYPNPAEEILYIDYKGNMNLQIEIHSNVGQIVYTGIIHQSHTEIDLQNFPAGIYFLKAISANEENRLTFVKD